MNKRKFSKTGLVLVGSMLICLLICLAVLIPGGGLGGAASEDLNDENTPDLKTVMNEGRPVLIYDKRPQAQALIAAYDDGALEGVWIRGEKDTEVTVPSDVKELYRLLKNVVVTGEAGQAEDEADGQTEQVTLAFGLPEGQECDYTLIGSSLLAIGDAKYTVTGAGPLLEEIRKLQ